MGLTPSGIDPFQSAIFKPHEENMIPLAWQNNKQKASRCTLIVKCNQLTNNFSISFGFKQIL